jgi:predicted PurR-regulated permease PerM
MDSAPRRVDISWATIARLIIAAALVWIWLHVWQWVLLFVAAIFIAIALDPLVIWLEQRVVRRIYAAPAVVFLLGGVIGAFLYYSGASLVAEGRIVTARINEIQNTIVRSVPAEIWRLMPRLDSTGTQLGDYVAAFGRAVMNGLLSAVIALILTIYLLLDGRRTYEWFKAYAPRQHRPRVHETAVKAREAILAYVIGNAATSLIAFACTWIALAVLNVPAALLLALLAGLSDFIPVVGFFLSAAPALILGFAVSVPVGFAVAVFYILYNAIETYYISPKVYGRGLKMSNLAVIAAFALGAELGGVVGALIALPLVAIYPVVEDVWLRDRLGPDVVRDHRRIEQSEEH